MIVEVCANGFESARNAYVSGVKRIELCTQLAVGGLTPSRGEIFDVFKTFKMDVHVLIRPRKGDFVYSNEELDTMIKDIEHCKEIGCHGIVSGVLTSEGNIDLIATKRLIKAADGMDFTFHRAFDECKEPKKEIENLIDLGVVRLLSSGQEHKAIYGLELLIQLKDIAGDRLEVMPGSGINADNALVFKTAGFPSIHLSATSNKTDANGTDSFFERGSEGISDKNIIYKVVGIVS